MINRAEGWMDRLNAMAPVHDAVIDSPHPPATCAARLRAAFELAGQTSAAGRPIGVISDSGGWLSFFNGKNAGASRLTLTVEAIEAGSRLAARTELAPFVKLIAIVGALLIAWSAFHFVAEVLRALTGDVYRFHPISRLISLAFLVAIYVGVGLWARRTIAGDHDRLAAFVRDTVEGRLDAVTRPPPGRPSQSIVR